MNKSLFLNHYVREVLGVSSYLCPERVFKKRALSSSSNSCLVVVFEPLKDEDRALLKKILLAIQIFHHSLLEIKEDKEEFFKKIPLEIKNLKCPVLVFKDEILELNLKSSRPFLISPALKHLRGREAGELKKRLWEMLKTWKEGDRK